MSLYSSSSPPLTSSNKNNKKARPALGETAVYMFLFGPETITIKMTTIITIITMITSSQKLGRCASRRVSSVWKSLGWVTFGSKYLHTCNTLSENTLSEDTLLENTLSEDTLSKNTLSKNTLSENILSENTLSENTLSENTLSNFRKSYPDPKLKNMWGPLSSTFHVEQPVTMIEWKFESITDQRTNRLTWVGARDACASKKFGLGNLWI